MVSLTEIARAKINLTLHVGRSIPEGAYRGYHPVDSLVVFADFGDELNFRSSENSEFLIKGEFAQGLEFEADNLVSRALKACHAPPQDITLVKNIPVSAGLGGGSANAAAALRLFDKDRHVDEAAMGADIPVCCLSQTALMRGIGEQVTPLRGKGQVASVLVNPRITVSTAAIFGAFDSVPRAVEPKLSETKASLLNIALAGHNDLQPIAEEQAPVIRDVIKAIAETQGSVLSRMSGSGATCFGLYGNMNAAKEAEIALKQSHPNWWVRACKLGDEA